VNPENILVPAVLLGLGCLYGLVVRGARRETLILPAEGAAGPWWWPLGDGLWRGATRSILVILPLVMVFIVLGWSFNHVDPNSPLYDVLGAAGFLLLMVVLVLTASIALVNRPRWAVPRTMRSHLGIIAERRRRRARRAEPKGER
jgi:hypothetical protein